jgi:hypothetical protein
MVFNGIFGAMMKSIPWLNPLIKKRKTVHLESHHTSAEK